MKRIIICLALLSFSSYLVADRANGVTIVPFQLIGNSIFVKATVNDVTGNFLLDTGSPNLLLNSVYFDGIYLPQQPYTIQDINGHSRDMLHFRVKHLSMGDYQFDEHHAFVLDLQGIENLKKIKVAGIIGYSVLKEVELMFDFDNRQVLLFPLDRKGRRTCPLDIYEDMDSFNLRMSSHMAYITARLGEKKLRLGIDSGAEVNMLNKKTARKKPAFVKIIGNLLVKGITSKNKAYGKSMVEKLTIDGWEAAPLEMAIADLYPLNENLDVSLHGILGAPFLMQGKVAINFKRKKLYLRHSLNSGLAAQKYENENEKLVSALK
ncbi:MAG: retroviral-like aspartic protease family protein [Saprospiraceae bacterium]